MSVTTEKVTIELWCNDEQREALVREAYRSHVSGGIETLASTIINRLAEKLAATDLATRKQGFDAMRLLGVFE